MTLDKFGSHIFRKNSDLLIQENKSYNVVEIKNIKLYYNLVFPFVGNLNKKSGTYMLLQDRRESYTCPVECEILRAEFPSSTDLFINDVILENPIGTTIKKDDKITFKPKSGTGLAQFYGELLVKCLVEMENE